MTLVEPQFDFKKLKPNLFKELEKKEVPSFLKLDWVQNQNNITKKKKKGFESVHSIIAISQYSRDPFLCRLQDNKSQRPKKFFDGILFFFL